MKKIEISHFPYWSKKFKGIVVSFDFDVPQGMNNTIFVFTFKFIFFSYWLAIDKINKQ